MGNPIRQVFWGPEEKEGPDPCREQNEGTFKEHLKEICPSEKRKNTLGRVPTIRKAIGIR